MKNILTKENFQCNRYCGQCCKKLIIRANESDTEKIRKPWYEFW